MSRYEPLYNYAPYDVRARIRIPAMLQQNGTYELVMRLQALIRDYDSAPQTLDWDRVLDELFKTEIQLLAGSRIVRETTLGTVLMEYFARNTGRA